MPVYSIQIRTKSVNRPFPSKFLGLCKERSPRRIHKLLNYKQSKVATTNNHDRYRHYYRWITMERGLQNENSTLIIFTRKFASGSKLRLLTLRFYRQREPNLNLFVSNTLLTLFIVFITRNVHICDLSFQTIRIILRDISTAISHSCKNEQSNKIFCLLLLMFDGFDVYSPQPPQPAALCELQTEAVSSSVSSSGLKVRSRSSKVQYCKLCTLFLYIHVI